VRSVLLAVALVVTATACEADNAPTATGTLHGKRVKFPKKGLAEGTKATIALLESCHDVDETTPALADLKKARQGDHVRLVFDTPVRVTILGKTYEVSEVIFTQPSNTGVFWLRARRRLARCTKFEPQNESPVSTWLKQARAKD
jgi:hypothetical protein